MMIVHDAHTSINKLRQGQAASTTKGLSCHPPSNVYSKVQMWLPSNVATDFKDNVK